MNKSKILLGMSNVSFWADDMKEAIKWYSELLGMEPYFVRPSAEAPEYAEFRIGDYEHELGIVHTSYLPEGTPRQPAGVVSYWHVDDIKAALEKVKSMGATDHQPLIEREAGFGGDEDVTARRLIEAREEV